MCTLSSTSTFGNTNTFNGRNCNRTCEYMARNLSDLSTQTEFIAQRRFCCHSQCVCVCVVTSLPIGRRRNGRCRRTIHMHSLQHPFSDRLHTPKLNCIPAHSPQSQAYTHTDTTRCAYACAYIQHSHICIRTDTSATSTNTRMCVAL